MIIYILFFSLASSLFSCFVVWSRLFFLVDVLTHASVLGLGISFLWGLSLPLSLFTTFFVLSCFVYLRPNRKESRLPLVSYSCLALGILVHGLANNPSLSYQSLFVGDLLLTQESDAFVMGGLFVLALIFGIRYKRTLFLLMLNEELALVEDVRTKWIKGGCILLLILFLSFSFESIGALLCPGLLVIPPLTAHLYARSTLQMIMLTAIITIFCMSVGVSVALFYDIPTSPCILLCCSALYLTGRFLPQSFKILRS